VTRVAVVGVGALGQHHARVYASLPSATLVGVCDKDEARAGDVARTHGVAVLHGLDEVIAAADAVSVAVPTGVHHPVARRLLEAGKDVLLEKPMTVTLEEADDLIALATSKGAVLQIGHIERFNPATVLLLAEARGPRFIEAHRLGSFSPRSLDIDVVLDLMIHDLDIVLALDGSEVVQVDAVGVPVLTSKVDIASARLRFRSGLIANLTASRVSTEKVRKFRVFAPRTYISADFAAKETQVSRLTDRGTGRPEIVVERTSSPDQEPLRLQLEAFLRVVGERGAPVVSAADGRRALALAHVVLARMEDVALPLEG
jgi:predicted dehydrogenase